MPNSILVNIMVQSAVMIILCIGFTFIYMMEKFPNFGHTAIATVGTLIAYALVRIWGYNPYTTWLISAAACGALTVGLYFAVVRPIKENGANIITLTFVFFAIAMVIGSIVDVFSYWFLYNQGYPTEGFWLTSYDFTWQGYPGVFIVSLPLCVVLVTALYLFLTRVKLGIAMRAVAENESLAAVLGVNTHAIHIFSWFLTGVLAGLVGAIIPLWQYSGLGYSDTFLVIVMAGSVLGGLQSIAGAVIGGFLITLAQKGLTLLMITRYGIVAADWEGLIPPIVIFVVLMIEPEGIMGISGKSYSPATLRSNLTRFRQIFAKVSTSLR
jgi:branched-subunit amino acid ABC-type transport system permease component